MVAAGSWEATIVPDRRPDAAESVDVQDFEEPSIGEMTVATVRAHRFDNHPDEHIQQLGLEN